MARTLTVTLTSDKSDKPIPVGTGGRVRVLFNDPDKIDMRADLTDDELVKLISDYKLKPVTPRESGRKKRLTL